MLFPERFHKMKIPNFQRNIFSKKPFLCQRLENHGFLKTYQNTMSHQDEVIGFSIEFLLPDQVLFLFAFGLELEVAAMPFGEKRCRRRKKGEPVGSLPTLIGHKEVRCLDSFRSKQSLKSHTLQG